MNQDHSEETYRVFNVLTRRPSTVKLGDASVDVWGMTSPLSQESVSAHPSSSAKFKFLSFFHLIIHPRCLFLTEVLLTLARSLKIASPSVVPLGGSRVSSVRFDF